MSDTKPALDHWVYFGTNFNEVRNRVRSAVLEKGGRPIDDEQRQSLRSQLATALMWCREAVKDGGDQVITQVGEYAEIALASFELMVTANNTATRPADPGKVPELKEAFEEAQFKFGLDTWRVIIHMGNALEDSGCGRNSLQDIRPTTAPEAARDAGSLY